MKTKFTKIAIAVLFLSCAKISTAQTTVTLRLDSSGNDAQIQNFNPNLNQGNLIEYYLGGWTSSGNNVTWMQMLQFDLASIPSSSIIQSAHLKLYYPTANLNHSYCCDTSLTHSNASLVQRITSPWSENTVTWNTQPTFTTVDEANIPASTNGTESYDIDVTNMVQTMVNTVNYGFLLQMADPSPYAQLLFASGDNPDTSQHPHLVITYLPSTTTCVTLRLGPADEDAQIQNFDPNLNQGNLIEYYLGGWTSSGNNVTWMQMLKFNMTSIPSNATVQSANLSLFYPTANLNHSYCCDTSLTHSNASLVQRITSSWSESTVTWNTQPTYTTVDEASIPPSTSPTESYYINVTNMVKTMLSTVNYGFLLQMVDPSPYAQLLFASGDNPDSTQHPLLKICYTTPQFVNDINPEVKLSIYPNPLSSSSILQLNTRLTNAEVVIYDMVGKEMMRKKLTGDRMEIEKGGLQSGVYVVKVGSEGRQWVEKMVVE